MQHLQTFRSFQTAEMQRMTYPDSLAMGILFAWVLTWRNELKEAAKQECHSTEAPGWIKLRNTRERPS